MSNNEKLIQAFSEALTIPSNRISDDLSYNKIPEWDSVAHMMLISELENVFGVMLDTDDILEMSTVAVARNILIKHGVPF